jgi:hypothetical protein
MEARADDNQRIMTSDTFPAEEAGHNAIISRPFRILSCHHWPSAEALGLAAAELIGEEPVRKKRGGPEGRMQRLLEQASKLPRSQQEKIAAVIEAFVNQHSGRET